MNTYYCKAYKNGELIAAEFGEIEWFKSKYSDCDKFVFSKYY